MKYSTAIFIKKFYKPVYKNNVVVLVMNGKKIYNPRIKGLEIMFQGNNNYLEIGYPCKFTETKLVFSKNNSTIKIGRFGKIRKTKITCGENSSVILGDYFNVRSMFISLLGADNTNVEFGSHCLLSLEILIRPSDGHAIFDKDTKELLNPPQDIKIGNHVWIGQRAVLLKGAEIPENCVIGAGALVNKKFTESNCVIAGTPAKIIKRGINWDICTPSQWKDKKPAIISAELRSGK